MSILSRLDLRLLRAHLLKRQELIQRAASLTRIDIGPIERKTFRVQVFWRDGDYVRFYGADSLPNATPCAIARLLVREILTHRGI